MKQLDITYKQIQLMRELLIEELSTQFSYVGVPQLELVELRLQTLIMAGLDRDDIAMERNNFKRNSVQS